MAALSIERNVKNKKNKKTTKNKKERKTIYRFSPLTPFFQSTISSRSGK